MVICVQEVISPQWGYTLGVLSAGFKEAVKPFGWVLSRTRLLCGCGAGTGVIKSKESYICVIGSLETASLAFTLWLALRKSLRSFCCLLRFCFWYRLSLRLMYLLISWVIKGRDFLLPKCLHVKGTNLWMPDSMVDINSFHSWFVLLRQDLSRGTVIFDLVTFTLKVDLLLKNFNHGFSLVWLRGWPFNPEIRNPSCSAIYGNDVSEWRRRGCARWLANRTSKVVHGLKGHPRRFSLLIGEIVNFVRFRVVRQLFGEKDLLR